MSKWSVEKTDDIREVDAEKKPAEKAPFHKPEAEEGASVCRAMRRAPWANSRKSPTRTRRRRRRRTSRGLGRRQHVQHLKLEGAAVSGGAEAVGGHRVDEVNAGTC